MTTPREWWDKDGMYIGPEPEQTVGELIEMCRERQRNADFDEEARDWGRAADALARLTEEKGRYRDALVNVSVHTGHLPDAPRDLLAALLSRCLDIATRALHDEPRSGSDE
jgi:hypothetical protein